MTKTPQQKESNTMGCLGAILVFWLVGSGVTAWRVPERASEAVIAGMQPHAETIRGLLREAGNADVAGTGPWDDHVQARFSGLVKSLQGDSDWGWEHVPDGVWSEDYSKHLERRIKVNPKDGKSQAVAELKIAADALSNTEVNWTPSIWDACALEFWNGFLSGFADEAVIWMRFEGEAAQEAAREDYKNLIEFGHDYAPLATAILSLLGAVFSAGTLLGYWLLVSYAPSADAAFKGGMFVEVGECLAYLVGQRWTLGYWSEGWWKEVGVAVVLGLVFANIEASRWKKRHPGKS